MRRAVIIVATAIVALCAIVALPFYVHTDPSTKDLDSDIAAVRSQITGAEADAAKYEGGLLRAMIDLRLEVLRTTESMLQQKRTSLIHEIELKYACPVTASQEKLDAMTSDIAAAQTKLEADERRAAQSGGLIQVLALATVATHRLAIAQLHLSYLGSKYGFVLPQIQPSPVEKKEAEPPGTPVQDRQVFE